MIAFDVPMILYASPVIAFLGVLLALWAKQSRVRHAMRWSERLGSVAVSTGRWGPLILGLSVFAAAAALAGPRFGRRVVTTETRALNLVIAIDISRSMLAEDVEPSRLGRAQQEAQRLIQDLQGDRIGLIAFSGRSFILSPLTVDAGALHLLVDGLDPDMTSAGGTELALALNQGRDLLLAGGGVADRVLVVFGDGEAHDSLPGMQQAAQRLRRDGIHLILVAEGRREPATIPVRDPDGVLIGFQRDPDDEVVETMRRDDILESVADAGRGVVVSAMLSDQAGAVRDLVSGYKRSPETTSTAAQDVSRAWIPLLGAVVVLLFHTLSRRTAALAVIALLLALPSRAFAQGLPNRGDVAYGSGDFRRAAQSYLRQVRRGDGGDTALLNLGTAALALGDTIVIRQALTQAGESIDPEIRFRALYNLGLHNLWQADADSANREAHLAAAQAQYREALLLKPGHADAKWNYELTLRPAPPQNAGGQQQQPQGGGGSGDDQEPPPSGELSLAQALQILDSMLDEERRTRTQMNRRQKRARDRRGRRDW